MLTATDLQRQTLRLYGVLLSRRKTAGGGTASYAARLVLCCGEGSSATGLPAAVSIAGGTMLALDPDAAAVKAVLRQGGVDFVVNTLDESVRVIKNQIRQGRSLSVALIADPQHALAEMIERGLQPDLHVAFDSRSDFGFEPHLDRLAERGMQRLELSGSDGTVRETEPLTRWLGERAWSETTIETPSATALRALDAQLLGILPPSDTLRRTWLQRISSYQRSSPGFARVTWLTAAERDALGAATSDARLIL